VLTTADDAGRLVDSTTMYSRMEAELGFNWRRRKRRDELCRLLLTAGADPKLKGGKNGSTPLHHTAQYQGEALLLLVSDSLQAGADPGSTAQGFTPLHGTTRNPEVTVSLVEALLEAGADPMLPDQDSNTLPQRAAGWTDDVTIVEPLLDARADLRAENRARS